jgi:hypothetical protein
VEHVIVEEPFRLVVPQDGSSPSKHGITATAGDGCYVSATVQNRRYYGVLVDQAALKTASELFFQNEAESLQLNRRMKLLYQQQQQQKKEKKKQDDNNNDHDHDDERKRPGKETKASSPVRQVDQKRKADETATSSSHTTAISTKEGSLLKTRQEPSIVSPPVELDDHGENGDRKRARLLVHNNGDEPRNESALTPAAMKNPPTTTSVIPSRPVQKFQYLPPPSTAATYSVTTEGGDDEAKGPGYRVLLATYADLPAAVQDVPTRARAVENACQAGGGFVGDFYYQYEVNTRCFVKNKTNTSNSESLNLHMLLVLYSGVLKSVHHVLDSTSNSKNSTAAYQQTEHGLRMSMGFESFLRETALPQWFPLSNLEGGGQKVLSLLSMKRNHKGGVVWDDHHHYDKILPDATNSNGLFHSGTHVPMAPRTKYRIGIVGGGIAGLACAQELLRSCDREMIDVEVVLLEGRSRLGGRLWTDTDTFQTKTFSSFPVDLGASWIHGIDDNPLAALAREAGTHFVTVDDEVKMLGEAMHVIDKDCDERMGKLFDDILEQAVSQNTFFLLVDRSHSL